MLEQTPAGLSVFSTYVEVILKEIKQTAPDVRVLHVCGGDPLRTRFHNFKY